MKFRKKPIVIEAFQYTGPDSRIGMPQEFINALEPDPVISDTDAAPMHFHIKTLEGHHQVRAGDWIIKGVKGEFYPCKHDIFCATYESAG